MGGEIGGGRWGDGLASENVAGKHGVVLALTLLGMLCLPWVLLFFISADEALHGDRIVPGKWRRRFRRRAGMRLGSWRSGRLLHRVSRRLDSPRNAPLPVEGFATPSIERLAAELRRLDRQRFGIATQSWVWHIAVQQAYDDRLRMASRCLGVDEHLGELTGMDLEIERLRIEGELEAAGLILRTP